MAKTKAERLAEIHREAMREFDEVQSAQRDVRIQCLAARRFYSLPGAQWEGALGDQFENKPRFEVNKVHLAVIRIFNEYRNNRITVDFQPKDGETDEFSDVCDGLYRADEQASTAEEAYDNSFEEGVGGGMGAWRLRACYEDEDDEENDQQRVKIEPIFDADTCVFFDNDAKRVDKSDAKRCWVLTPMTREAAKEKYGHEVADIDRFAQEREYVFDWVTPDFVWIAEYYRVEEYDEVYHYFQGLDEDEGLLKFAASELEEDPKALETLLATGFREVRQRRMKRRRVRKYIMSGLQVEEDAGIIAGKHIPIVPYYGKRWVVDGVERYMGHVHLAMDAQRLVNMLLSWLGEMAARFDVEKPILTPQQVAGHAQMWAEDNVKKFPYLLINPLEDASGNTLGVGPQAYTKAPQIPPAMAALMQIAEQALQDLLGNQQAGEEIQPNLSGKAVELIQNRLDMQAYIYLSNFAKAMRRCGQIWLSMMSEIAVEENRRMKIVDASGAASSVLINRLVYDQKQAKAVKEHDFSKANYDVVVNVGPSSQSMRSAVVRALTGVAAITEDPATKQALTLATIANLEGEGLQDLRDWARRQAVRLGIVKPTDEEQAEMAQEQANAQPDPQAEFLLAEAAQSRAKTVETIASAELKQAQTAKTIAETEGEGLQQQLNVADAFQRAATPPKGEQ